MLTERERQAAKAATLIGPVDGLLRWGVNEKW